MYWALGTLQPQRPPLACGCVHHEPFARPRHPHQHPHVPVRRCVNTYHCRHPLLITAHRRTRTGHHPSAQRATRHPQGSCLSRSPSLPLPRPGPRRPPTPPTPRLPAIPAQEPGPLPGARRNVFPPLCAGPPRCQSVSCCCSTTWRPRPTPLTQRPPPAKHSTAHGRIRRSGTAHGSTAQ